MALPWLGSPTPMARLSYSHGSVLSGREGHGSVLLYHGQVPWLLPPALVRRAFGHIFRLHSRSMWKDWFWPRLGEHFEHSRATGR